MTVRTSADQWRRSAQALLKLDAKGALAPHGIGGLARELLEAALEHIPDTSEPMEWIVRSGRWFAILPVRCEDGKLAWLCWLNYADVNLGMFYSPYTTRRVYRRAMLAAAPPPPAKEAE